MQVLRVVYFSRTGYFTLVLSSGIWSCELLNGPDLALAETTKSRDGAWEVHD